MIDDALKTTRNVHRLIISISLITLVFVLSLNAPADKVAQRDAIAHVLQIDYSGYDRHVDNLIHAHSDRFLQPVSQSLELAFDSEQDAVSGLADIAIAFSQPVHIGRLRTGATVLADPSRATLSQLEAWTVIDADRDIQVVIPDVTGLSEHIQRYLNENARPGMRVSNIRIGLDFAPRAGATFLVDESPTVTVSFELVEFPIRGGVPVFTTAIPAVIETIPGSSLKDWMLANVPEDIVTYTENGFVWLPLLSPLPPGFRQEELGTLYRRLSADVARQSHEGPDSKLVVLGTSIPGVLVGYAAPILLLVLSAYFAGHARHLRTLAGTHTDELRQFAWMPIALGRPWPIEFVVTCGVLPVATLCAYIVKLQTLESLSWPVMAVTCVACITISVVCVKSVGAIRSIRQHTQP